MIDDEKLERAIGAPGEVDAVRRELGGRRARAVTSAPARAVRPIQALAPREEYAQLAALRLESGNATG